MTAITAQGSPGNMSFHHSTESGIAGSSFHSNTDESIPRSSPIAIQEQVPRASPHRPTPLPDFVFPMKPAPSSPSPRSAPASFSRGVGRRPISAFELKGGPAGNTIDNDGGSPRATLPDFTFGSQAQSPPISPRSIPSRPGFHKRGGSEFIGGDGLTGNGGGLMSTSPTKGQNAMSLPKPAALGPPAGRRGHAHRRSAAISCHDLSMVLKPDPNLAQGGVSAPTSPSAAEHNPIPFQESLSSAVQPDTEDNPATDFERTTPIKAFNRNRVGFSDFVDIIPRPLSLVSSDSSSTVRQGHSVTGSMSSIVSGGTSSPQPKGRGLVIATHKSDARPRTAEPFTMDHNTSRDLDAPRRRNSTPLLLEVAAASNPAPSTPRSLKKWSFFGGGHESGESSPKSRPTSSASSDAKQKHRDSAPSTPETSKSDTLMQSTEQLHTRRSSSLTRKSSKKPKKVRAWAGSILSRKSRQRKTKLNRRSPTPPLRSYGPVENNEGYDFNEPDQQMPPPLSPMPEVETDIASWKPRQVPIQEEDASPIIDLDAALGPFNTPTSFGEDWEASQRAGSNRKRAMHSAAGLGGFSGPGMHYHRRAESAPEFENPRFGINRLGGGATMGMEDVFEEENEDEDWEDTKASDKESVSKGVEDDEAGLGIDIKVVDSEGMEAEKAMDFEDSSFQRGVKRKGSGLSDGDRRVVSSNKSEHSNRSVIDEPITEDASPVEIVDDTIPPRSDSGSKSSDSTATPPLRPAAKELAPVDIQPFTLHAPYPTPTSPPSTIPSSFPSPRSPYSYDAQRISTAQSSITEDNFQSLLLGEPGPEIRMSVDDVPSLTSSNSTMTRESGLPMTHNNSQLREGQRSASMSSAAISRKRSSIASLSRLISSSHGEKSKLSIESRPSTSEGAERTEKAGRGKRLSRLMQFWKPKDS